jgi:DNA-binding CsgD family transcriptional regulator
MAHYALHMRALWRIFGRKKKRLNLGAQLGTLVTAEEIARLIGIAPRTVRHWGRMGKIPRVKITAKVVRFDLGDVLKALKSSRPTKLREDDEKRHE